MSANAARAPRVEYGVLVFLFWRVVRISCIFLVGYTICTVVWETDGNVQLSSEAEFAVRLDAGIDPKKLGGRSGFSGGSDRNFVTVDSRGIPLGAVQAVLLHVSSKEAENVWE